MEIVSMTLYAIGEKSPQLPDEETKSSGAILRPKK